MAAFVVTALAMTGPPGASAHDNGLGTSQDRTSDTGQAVVLAALERDLGLSEPEVAELLDTMEGADRLAGELSAQLGADFAGSWFDHEAGSLVVAATDSGAAQLARAAGAETRVVRYSKQELDAIVGDLDALAEADPDALASAFSWGVVASDNQVVLTVRDGQADAVAGLVAEYGDAVRIEESDAAPSLASHGGTPWLDGGMAYNGCSVGFNVRNTTTGDRYFLTAGHCGPAGGTASSHGITIGTVVASFFGPFDDALVQVDSSANWLQGPYVWTYPGFITISGFTDAGEGWPVCKSGRTTQVTCGVITVKDETVNVDGVIVEGLTRDTTCVERGDSGGPHYNIVGNFAEGMSSAAALDPATGLCKSKVGGTNASWYFPIADSLAFYGPAFGVTLW